MLIRPKLTAHTSFVSLHGSSAMRIDMIYRVVSTNALLAGIFIALIILLEAWGDGTFAQEAQPIVGTQLAL